VTTTLLRYWPRGTPIPPGWRSLGAVPGHHGHHYLLLEEIVPISFDAEDLHATALTLIGEARSEGREGMTAVAWVIRNRVADARWPGNPRRVVLEKHQFSAWLEREANIGNLHTMATAGWADGIYREAHAIAAAVFAGLLDDPTDGATHYHTTAVEPAWADPEAETARVGDHVFYAL